LDHSHVTLPVPGVNELVALFTFAFVGSVSPGPNNAVLWASGVAFGFRRTIPHVLGTSAGIGALVVGVAAGIGSLLETVPSIEIALKVAGSAYLLVLAFLVVRGGAVRRASVAHPLTLWQAVAFQCLNPKAWVFVVAAVGTFLPPKLPWPIAVSLLTGVIAVIVGMSSSIWAAGGAALGGVIDNEGRRRAVSVVLAVLLVGSVALIWA
jgi:threonine/homoserine/homoserine lactone efflux protein